MKFCVFVFLLPPRRSPVIPGLALPAATQESEVDLSNRHKVGTRSAQGQKWQNWSPQAQWPRGGGKRAKTPV